MDYFFFFLLSLTLPSSTFSFTGDDGVRNITAVQGNNCTLLFPKPKTQNLTVLEWSRSDLDKNLLVFRGRRVLSGYEDPLYRNRVELLDPQLQINLGVVLKKVTFNDTGMYRCKVVYEVGQKKQKIFHFIHLTVTKQGKEDTDLTLGLTLGLVIGPCILILIVLCVFVKKRLNKSKFCFSEGSCPKRSEKYPIPPDNSKSSSSPPSSTLHNTSPPPSQQQWETFPLPLWEVKDQTTLNPPPSSSSCPPSPAPPSESCHLNVVEGFKCSSPGTQPGPCSQDWSRTRSSSDPRTCHYY